MTRILIPILAFFAVAAAASLYLGAGGESGSAMPDGESEGAIRPGVASAPTDDAERLEAWFEAQVMRELEAQRRADSRGAPAAEPTNPARPEPDALSATILRPRAPQVSESLREVEAAVYRGEPGGPVEPAARRTSVERLEELRRRPGVDWDYVNAFFSGRISGIPDESRAGLTIPEMDEIAPIPYVEQLRTEERYDELRDLGFEDATYPWPVCLRVAKCRRDRASSPP